jgi:phosphohistidine phosphatase SixA/8-oxo-dGTP pyrophosphatase MutT (NUDIX family)
MSTARSAADRTEIRAAGGVLWRPGTRELAVVHRPRYNDWSLPKGKLDDDEPAVVAAGREVFEETGIRPVLGQRLPTVRYNVVQEGAQRSKQVDYWSMRCAANAAAVAEFVTNSEVDDLRWCDPELASTLLSYDHDRAVVQAATALPIETTTIVLVRHGRAGDKRRWAGSDDDRPLDEVGREQAQCLSATLHWFAPTRLLSAPIVRCQQTIAPLAENSGIELRTDEVWSEKHHGKDPERAARRVRELAAGGETVAIASQGGVIPDTVATLAADDGIALPSTSAAKGSAWVLSFAAGRLAGADYLPPN